MFDWADYLKLAQELSGRSEEACQRSAISRSYYALFNLALNWLFLRQRTLYSSVHSQPSSLHQALWQAFIGASDPVWIDIGVLGFRLRDFRNRADYDNSISRLPDVLATAIADAEELRSLLDSLYSSK